MRGTVEHVGAGCAALTAREVAGDGLELQGCTVGERVLGVDHGGQRLVVDVHQLSRVDRLGPGLRHDHGDRLTDEAHAVGGQRHPGAVGVDGHEGDDRPQVEVRRGEDRQHPRGGASRLDVERLHPRVGDVAAHEHGVQHPGHRPDVVDVGAPSTQQVGVLDPADGVSQQ